MAKYEWDRKARRAFLKQVYTLYKVGQDNAPMLVRLVNALPMEDEEGCSEALAYRVAQLSAAEI